MAKSGAATMIRMQVLDHVVPEQLAVVDADEAEDGHPRGEERADPGRRLAGRPGVARVEGVVPPHAPQVEGQGGHDHGHRDEVELGGEELRPPQGRESRVGERGDHLKTVPPVSAVLPNALGDPAVSVEGGRVEEAQLLGGQAPAEGTGVLLAPGPGSWPRGWARRPWR